MLQTQQNFVDYLGQLDSLAQKARLDKDKSKLIASIKERELLIPVVGGFSAGKSSALNDFLGEDILSVAITPETALATELRWTSGESYAEGVKDNDSVEKIAIANLDSLKTRASEFKYLRLYLNNPKLQAIEPLILVDMPGFDAPLELHNKAIMEYLQRGIYFIILESAESGTIAMSIKKHIDSLQTLGRDFSFCLSKVDLQPNIDEVKGYIADDLEAEFSYDKGITLLGKNSNRGEALQTIITQINAEQLFDKLYRDELKMDFIDTKSSLTTKISSLKATKEEADNAVKELDNAIKKIERTKENLEQQSFNVQGAVDSSLNASYRALIADKEALAEVVVKDKDTFANQIAETIRGTLLNEFIRKGKEQRESLINTYKLELNELNLPSNFKLDSQWVNDLTDSIALTLQNVSINTHSIGESIKQWGQKAIDLIDSLQKFLSKLVVFPWLNGILSSASSLLEKVIDFGSGIVSMFGGKKVDADEIMAQILPTIRKELEPEISKSYKEQIQAVREAIALMLKAKFEEKQNEIQKAQAQKTEIAQSAESEIGNLNAISNELDSLASKYIFK